MGRLDALYARMPVWAQHAAVSAYGGYWYWLRFGPGFASEVRAYRARESFAAHDWIDWQQARVSMVLEAAAAHVPYYRQTWTPAERAAARAGRLGELPLLDKDPVRHDPEGFVRSDMRPLRRLTFHTSGSTGTPVASIWTTHELRSAMAIREARSAGWAGVSFTQRRATFSGRMVEPDPHSAGPYYRFNAVERQVYLSAFHLRPDTARQYVAALHAHGVQWLTGYAFSFYTLARLMLEQRLEPPPLSAVITTSEKVTPPMRRAMEEAFGCPVFQEYSMVENTLFASECAAGRLHVSPDAGVVEILRPDTTPSVPGETGEIVATSLLRTYQPLIRYRLGDLGRWATSPCPCGRAMPVIEEIVGRIEDAVVAPDGRELVRFHGLFVSLPRVREAQVVQEALTRLRIYVVPAAGFDAADASEIVARARQRLGSDVDVAVHEVDAIPRSASGKFQAVISMLDRQAR